MSNAGPFKRTPMCAAVIMATSLAPSPTARVRTSGTPFFTSITISL